MTTDTFYGYITPPIDHALRVVVEERITELLAYRRWYRAQPNWSNWMDLARDHDAELRALVRLARQARRIAADAVPDPQSYTDAGWTNAELAEAYGR